MRNCSSCNRRIPMNRDSCMYCGAAAPPAEKARHQLKCPRCQSGLVEEQVDGILLDICHSCGGTWYDKSELEARIQHGLDNAASLSPHEERTAHLAGRNQTPGRVQYLPCPHCRKPMVPKNFGRNSGVIIDVCGYHGVFLDAGEFDRLLAFEEEGGSQKAAERDRLMDKMRQREAERDKEARRRRTRDYSRIHGRFLTFLR